MGKSYSKSAKFIQLMLTADPLHEIPLYLFTTSFSNSKGAINKELFQILFDSNITGYNARKMLHLEKMFTKHCEL